MDLGDRVERFRCLIRDRDARPHRALGQASSLGAVPPAAPTADMSVVRGDRLGGLIHEYAQVA